ncbi:hypothetical protein [Chamaesiphon polymorphus]|uniref:DUF4168 domain-containing protein n=1 Tax=Chamaesiphon polymorphus CCALA 037 TaxID=2107692 RepID=A0A2T1F631_9CYAN|nr:hypothetical protein [Chamaesiphon polymorphus]PSB40451.1 hypothetical protein C7B77_28320 [Chamaesiphon polymorphus CCALA 037]
MLRQIAIASILTLSSAVTLVNPAQAQTSDAQLNSILRQSRQAVSETNSYMNNVVRPEAQRYQNYLNLLRQLCERRYSKACQEYYIRMGGQLQHQDRVQQQYNYYIQWVNSLKP